MAETNDGWQTIYGALDSSTLLALLPVLKEGREKALEMMKLEERSHEQSEGADAYSAELWGEALAAFDARIAPDNPAREKLVELRDKVQQVLGEQVARTNEGKRDTRVQTFLWAHQQRELWIKQELARRSLLPTF
ncbi:hypothetical protein J7E97_05910 [Streptomyces sp. ISL-66]|uniref:hypothetical protein n=1 Tax=Streptomyces sp. ISL-66 TaxID=2819186 RepID=UPI001BE6FE95|nr:hypothetical protein [Streptomyces sp. ISL-66]MBT2467418.1 hypothetical protein [Streptomyces sp. ISL-66]